MIKKRRNLIFLSTIFLTMLLSFIVIGCDSSSDDDDLYKVDGDVMIGMVFPMDESYGTTVLAAINAVAKDVNDNGGLGNGLKFGYDIRSNKPNDTTDRATISVSVAAELLEEYPTSLVGFSCVYSDVVGAILQYAAGPAYASIISGTASSTLLSGVSPLFHRTGPTTKSQMSITAPKAIEYGMMRVAIAQENNNSFGQTIASDFTQYFTALGGTVVDVVYFDENDADYDAKLAQLYANDPDAVLTAFTFGIKGFFDKISANLSTLPATEKRFILTHAQFNYDTLQESPRDFIYGDVNGHPRTFVLAPWPNRSTSSYQFLEDTLENDYEVDVFIANPHFYDVVYIYALACEKAILDGYSPSDIITFRQVVNSNIRLVANDNGGDQVIRPENGWEYNKAAISAGPVNYEGCSGSCDIDSNGNVISNFDVYKIVEENGALNYFLIENATPLE